MRGIAALALLAVLGFAAAGCGSAKKANSGGPGYAVTLYKKAGSGSITVRGKATIPSVKPDTFVRCKGWIGRGVQVPPRGRAATVRQVVQTIGTPSGVPSTQIRLHHLWNGSLTVSCTQSH